jgi:dienelactone hydrolase
MSEALRTALADRYRIERELGAGGMATVYLARDLKHDRDVALKVLKPELAASLTGDRFVREIAITARLNHPHILPLLDSGLAGDGAFPFYVMPVATGESLQDRLARDRAIPVAEAVRLAREVAEGLAHAHAQGVVHRDVKPANVLLSGGHAVLVDFGIAKAVGDAGGGGLTIEGTSIGTPAYMAPEQAAGDADVGHAADVYAVGVMLFEMVSGAPPFTGPMRQVLAAKLASDAPRLRTRAPAVPQALDDLVARCLARDPAARIASAAELVRALDGVVTSAAVPTARRAPWLVVTAGALLVAGIAVAVVARERRARWVPDVAVPTLKRLVEADQADSGFELLEEMHRRAPGDTSLQALWHVFSRTTRFLSDPPGAMVSRAPLNDTTRWVPVGTTPTDSVQVPANAWYYRYEKPGYRSVTILSALLGGSYVPVPAPVILRKVTDPDSDMVALSGQRLVPTLFGLPRGDTLDLADFLMARLEVTNRQYAAFVNAGGYAKREYWDSTLVRDGKPVPFEAFVAPLVDKTGRPGPSTWEGGAPPPGTEDLPVGGVSWHEARAFARFAGKSLPTVVEWNAAAMPEAARWVVPTGRFEASGPVKGGDVRSVGARGVYDLAGNVREWTENAREPGTRFILGGGWTDPAYLFSEVYAQPEGDRSAINGIRLVRRLGASKDLPRAMAAIPRLAADYAHAKPVDDATFRGFAAMYEYDRAPLNPKVEGRDTTIADWIREDVTVDFPGGGARLPVVMILPRNVKPPWQPIVLWPASDALQLADTKHLSTWFVDYLVRGGRAVIYPIYEGTYGRPSRVPGPTPAGSVARRAETVRRVTELRRAVDYAFTRPDIDTTRLAYVATSWGGRMAPLPLALEPRIRTAVLNVAGLPGTEQLPEENPVNFLPRVRQPVLMLSGRFDSTFPYETSQKPFLQLLGSKDKKQILYDGGHFLPRTELVKESLAWLDRVLGPVRR